MCRGPLPQRRGNTEYICRWSIAHKGREKKNGRRKKNMLPATTVTIIYSLSLGMGSCHTNYKLRDDGQ